MGHLFPRPGTHVGSNPAVDAREAEVRRVAKLARVGSGWKEAMATLAGACAAAMSRPPLTSAAGMLSFPQIHAKHLFILLCCIP